MGRRKSADRRPADVCIIGSGFAGSVLGEVLARRGLRTIILEGGSAPSSESCPSIPGSGETFCSAGDIDYPFAATRIRGPGGTSEVWTGNSPRLHPLDFEVNAYTPDGASWPIGYQDIEPYYETAEETLKVRGGPLSSWNPPRRRNLPYPALKDVSTLKHLFAGLDVVVDDAPFSADENGHGALRVASSHLARFLELPAATLMTGTTVTRLLAGDRKQIVAAEIMNRSGRRELVQSRAFVVAAGGLETPRLLLCSRCRQFPRGMGNEFDCVGRPFIEHKGLRFYGLLERSRTETLEESLNGHCHQFYTSFKKRGLGSILLFMLLADRIHLSGWDAELPMELNSVWETGRVLLRIAASVELQAVPENRVVLDDRKVDEFGIPAGRLLFNETVLDRATIRATIDLIHGLFEKLSVKEIFRGGDGWGGHHMGTCRMGDDPRNSVVDPQLKVYGTSNLFLAGSSVFVTGGASNPTLTIVALTLRLADQICDDFASGRL